ncbi:hypothetical protein C8J57DRAFT_1727319 [Mycena rebaudengoi]|nr:hypothetical protein C8J57DRAFT_1727319 [Mycena rebaudengoi]
MGASLSTVYVPNWQQECATRFDCSSSGLVNSLGAATSCLANSTIKGSPDIWGVTYPACLEKCSSSVLVERPDFPTVALPLAAWLFPWIQLIAQLPFEANGWANLLSACLALGSPALAAYSLMVTALNRRSISGKFQRLRGLMNKELPHAYMAERLAKAEYILRETQQCPMRANQRTGELGNLIALKDSHRQKFWINAAKDLKSSRRDITFPFLVQAYLITFINAVHESLGNPDVGLQFASSLVWSWMFPIVIGYICLGSQYRAGTIKDALEGNKILPPDSRGWGDDQFRRQEGLLPNADFYILLRDEMPTRQVSATTAVADDDDAHSGATTGSRLHIFADDMSDGLRTVNTHPSTSQLRVPVARNTNEEHAAEKFARTTEPQMGDALSPLTWLGFDVRGDEVRQGPIFNYARVLTSSACVGHVESGFKNSIVGFQAKRRDPETTEDAAKRCGFDLRHDLKAFKPLRELPTSASRNMYVAAFAAMFLQWGTTGAAIYVAYNTPAIGLSCRSGSYLIYAVASTLSWIALVSSNLFSHAFMRRVEEDPQRYTDAGVLGRLAVMTRLFGTVLACANAVWLIASSVMEAMGTFQNCWCQTAAFQYHEKGWTALFKGQPDLREIARHVWIGGFVWSVVVSLAASITFGVISMRKNVSESVDNFRCQPAAKNGVALQNAHVFPDHDPAFECDYPSAGSCLYAPSGLLKTQSASINCPDDLVRLDDDEDDPGSDPTTASKETESEGHLPARQPLRLSPPHLPLLLKKARRAKPAQSRLPHSYLGTNLWGNKRWCR